ncbi:tRNA-splicing endonuclease subunit sen54 [Sporothrix stenoceras]|uniref:tRNA-splicing endonuclease subunit sen54 n=1 Tax=Sporothrix stenoceras TaxID=5173 RepID=A0ABR3Z485_9PEZI
MPPAEIPEDDGDDSRLVAEDVTDDADASILIGDDDDEAALPIGGASSTTAGDEEDDADDDEDGGAEIQDYRGFAALVGAGTSSSTPSSTVSARKVPHRKPQISSQTIRKGEKDFEEHGTRAQQNALEQSRAVMESVLEYTRVHNSGGPGVAGSKNASSDIVRGWYFPDVWGEEADEEERAATSPTETDSAADATSRRFAHTRHRVVMVEAQKGPMFASVGAVPGKPKWIPTLPKDQQPTPKPGYDRVWLLPEEALFLIERGSMELWWPLKDIDEILAGPKGRDEVAEEDGVPLSLEAAYALFIGPDNDSQHGRIPLPTYQVYTHLRRSGYQVLRAVKTDPQTPLDPPLPPAQPPAPTSIWQWLFSLLSPSSTSPTSSTTSRPNGPLVQPGFYRSYGPIYNQLRLIPPHRYEPPSKTVAKDDTALNPFKVVFHVWKAGVQPAAGATGTPAKSSFSKIRPPPPDFYMAVVDAHATGVPTLQQVEELLASVPPLSAEAGMSKRQRAAAAAAVASKQLPASKPSTSTTTSSSFSLPLTYRRLKFGRRCVIVAVVDHGIVNYMRFSDSTFSQDALWPRFDSLTSGKFVAGANGRKNKGKSGGGKNQKKSKAGGSGSGGAKKTAATKASEASNATSNKDAPSVTADAAASATSTTASK